MASVEPQNNTPSATGTSRDAVRSSRTLLRWITGTSLMLLAIGLSVVHLTFREWSENWSVAEQVGFRAGIACIAFLGVMQIALALSAARGMVATPRLGSHQTLIPPEGFAYLGIMCVLFTGAMLTKQNTLLLVFAMMAGPFVVNGSLTFGMLKSAKVVRSSPRRAMAGELFGVEVTLTNRHPFLALWMMTVKDTITHTLERLTVQVLFARVASRSTQLGHYQLRLARRGRYRLGPTIVSSRFPLGLVERNRLFVEPGEILIYPRVGRLNPHWKRQWQGAAELVAQPQPRPGVFHDEFHRLREFRIGDNPRDIHWRTSARRGELILREYQQNRSLNLAVVVDLYQPSIRSGSAKEQDDQRELLEGILSLALTFIVEHGRDCRDGSLSLAASGATSFQWEGQCVSASLESLFDQLALLEPGEARETGRLLNETSLKSTSSTQIVLFTNRALTDNQNWNEAVNNPRVHTVVIASLDQLDGILHQDADSPFNLEEGESEVTPEDSNSPTPTLVTT
jgi:uncharacterized protein (DUF58 family)